jgi:hypothetical protein
MFNSSQIQTRTPTLCCNKYLSLTVKLSQKRGSFLAPKRAVCVAGVSLTAARWLRAVDAGESPYGGGETGAGTDEPKSTWFSGP